MKLPTTLAVLLAASQFACASTHIGEAASANIINNQGKSVGHAHFTQGNHGVLIEINVQGLPAGKHGMHFHEVGSCDDTEKFKQAKGHIMPTGKPHGYLNPEGPHEGNLPNLIVGTDGRAHVELYSSLVSISGHEDTPALLDDNGSTLMIHTNVDDHKTQPIGGSGARIGCGLITAK